AERCSCVVSERCLTTGIKADLCSLLSVQACSLEAEIRAETERSAEPREEYQELSPFSSRHVESAELRVDLGTPACVYLLRPPQLLTQERLPAPDRGGSQGRGRARHQAHQPRRASGCGGRALQEARNRLQRAHGAPRDAPSAGARSTHHAGPEASQVRAAGAGGLCGRKDRDRRSCV
ncbi:hypothetical protein B484DRAFT_472005, partial [Ochromonadaceae sp. CCMP2298]